MLTIHSRLTFTSWFRGCGQFLVCQSRNVGDAPLEPLDLGMRHTSTCFQGGMNSFRLAVKREDNAEYIPSAGFYTSSIMGPEAQVEHRITPLGRAQLQPPPQDTTSIWLCQQNGVFDSSSSLFDPTIEHCLAFRSNT